MHIYIHHRMRMCTLFIHGEKCTSFICIATHIQYLCIVENLLWCSVRPSVTTRCSVKTDVWIMLVFSTRATRRVRLIRQSIERIRVYAEIRVYFLGNLVPSHETPKSASLSTFSHCTSTVASAVNLLRPSGVNHTDRHDTESQVCW